VMKCYKGLVLDTIANALSWPVGMTIVGTSKKWPSGVVFPVKSVEKDYNSIFPIQKYDWADIDKRIKPLIDNVLRAVRQHCA